MDCPCLKYNKASFLLDVPQGLSASQVQQSKVHEFMTMKR